jgi:hypothetical protein
LERPPQYPHGPHSQANRAKDVGAIAGHEGTATALTAWRGKRVALLLRGQAYRGSPMDKGHYTRALVTTCNASYSRLQEHAWRTLKDRVVSPLEAAGAAVAVVAAECSSAAGCKLAEVGLPRIFGERMLAVHTHCEAANQGESMRATLSTFRARMGGVPVASRYDLVLITRHDLNWALNITQWPQDLFARFHYLGRCMMRCGTPGPTTRTDVTADRGACHPVLGGTTRP